MWVGIVQKTRLKQSMVKVEQVFSPLPSQACVKSLIFLIR